MGRSTLVALEAGARVRDERYASARMREHSLSFSRQVSAVLAAGAYLVRASTLLILKLMRFRQIIPATLMMAGAISACSKAQQPPAPAGTVQTTQPVTPPAAIRVPTPEEQQLYLDAARTSWNVVNKITEPSTGFARAHAAYSYVTLWDIAGRADHGIGVLHESRAADLSVKLSRQLTARHIDLEASRHPQRHGPVG